MSLQKHVKVAKTVTLTEPFSVPGPEPSTSHTPSPSALTVTQPSDGTARRRARTEGPRAERHPSSGSWGWGGGGRQAWLVGSWGSRGRPPLAALVHLRDSPSPAETEGRSVALSGKHHGRGTRAALLAEMPLFSLSRHHRSDKRAETQAPENMRHAPRGRTRRAAPAEPRPRALGAPPPRSGSQKARGTFPRLCACSPGITKRSIDYK